jgi:hypothetical protein
VADSPELGSAEVMAIVEIEHFGDTKRSTAHTAYTTGPPFDCHHMAVGDGGEGVLPPAATRAVEAHIRYRRTKMRNSKHGASGIISR